jgi:hypothetical protein
MTPVGDNTTAALDHLANRVVILPAGSLATHGLPVEREYLPKTALNCGDAWWPGPGSNRRPSAFQAVTRVTRNRSRWSERCNRVELDPSEHLF